MHPWLFFAFAPRRPSCPPCGGLRSGNILIVNERRRPITESGTAAFLRSLSRLPLRIDRLPDENAILRLARAHRLSVYDAAYLELALREGLPLATLDADLRTAMSDRGVPTL